jgi:single-stranded-DNA-specific exonuclease
MTKRWTYAPEGSPEAIAALTEELGASYSALARVLVQRGMSSLEQIKAWIPGTPLSAVDPLRMADMPQAAQRLAQAREQGERVMLFGDYDVDGTTRDVFTQQHALRPADDFNPCHIVERGV